MFFVGQKVVCVASQWWWEHSGTRYEITSGPVLGEIYTVSGFNPRDGAIYLTEKPELSYSTVQGVQLTFVNPFSWNPAGFRPLVEKKTDAAVKALKKLTRLNTVKELT